MQESFIKVFEKLHMFEGRVSFKSWFYQIALNTVCNRLRGRVFDLLDVDDYVGEGADSGAEIALVKSDLKQMIR